MVLVLQRITLSMDDRSGFKRLFWKSLGEPNPAYVEKEDQLKQVNRGRGRPPKAPALPDEIPREATVTDEPKKRRVNYDSPGTEEYSRMQAAVREVWRKGSNVNISEVARMNNVKLQTLRNHVAKAKPAWSEENFIHIGSSKRGKRPMMAREFEALLTDHIVTMDNLNFALGRDQVMDIGQEIMKETGFVNENKNVCTHRWYDGFIKRNDLLTQRSQEWEDCRQAATNPYKVGKFFNNLENLYKKVEMLNGKLLTGNHVANTDETGHSKGKGETISTVYIHI